MEQKQYNLLFCWCFGRWIDDPVCVPTVFQERLIPRGPGVTLQADTHEIAVGGASDGMVTHQGDEMGHALEGVVDMIVEGLLRRQEAGDRFHFRSEWPYGCCNAGHTPTGILWVKSPPTFSMPFRILILRRQGKMQPEEPEHRKGSPPLVSRPRVLRTGLQKNGARNDALPSLFAAFSTIQQKDECRTGRPE